MTIDDVLGAELATGRAVPTAVAGEPYESWQVISDDGQDELGIWEVTPGHGDQAGRRHALPGRLVGHVGRPRDGPQDVRDRQDDQGMTARHSDAAA
jgi:hypothetical protein